MERELTQADRDEVLKWFTENWTTALTATGGLASLGEGSLTRLETRLQRIVINLTAMTDILYRMYLEQVEQQSGATRH